MQPQKESRSFLQRLLQNPPELPFEAVLLPMLFTATREQSTSDMRDLVALIERSQKLAARVLAIANSAAYGLEFKVSTLQRAVSILGIHEIRQLAVLVGMSSVIKEVKLPNDFNVTALWKHQLKTAAVAKALAAELGGHSGICGPCAKEEDRLEMAPDEAYVAGLLHDIGKVLFAASRPDLWEAVEEICQRDGGQYVAAECAYWDIDHALIGATMLHHWKLPMLLVEPINWHHAPELAPAHKMETRLLAAANIIAHNGLNAEGELCAEAVSFLPEGSDAAALGSAVAHSLASADPDAFVNLVE